MSDKPDTLHSRALEDARMRAALTARDGKERTKTLYELADELSIEAPILRQNLWTALRLIARYLLVK